MESAIEEGAVEARRVAGFLVESEPFLGRNTPLKVPFEMGSEDKISSTPSESGISATFGVRTLRLMGCLVVGRDGSGVAIFEAATMVSNEEYTGLVFKPLTRGSL